MQTKLTLTVDEEVIQNAKVYAKKQKRSLSNIVEEYLKSLSNTKSKNKKAKYSKIVMELKGSVQDPDKNKSYKELLQDSLIKKHLK